MIKNLTGVQPVRYVLGNPFTMTPYRNEEGWVLVFKVREQAMSFNERETGTSYLVMGMGQANWERFVRDFGDQILEVTDAVA